MLPLIAAALLGAQASPSHSSVRLLAGDYNPGPNAKLEIGLEVKLEPGWHTYWLNPGDSGSPIKVDLTLPEGWTAENWRWPAPDRFETAGIVSFGYSERAVLHATVTTGPTPLEAAQIKADVRLLVCEDACVPESGSATLDLKSGRQADAELEETAKLIPAIATNANATFAWGKQVVLEFDTEVWPASGHVQFFPAKPGTIDHATPVLEAEGSAGHWTLELKPSEYLQEVPETLEGVAIPVNANGRAIGPALWISAKKKA
ncbi:MAG: hypothetical protein KIT11_11100 [Fimbriimonadaceae bacterium]|nr:hypothetical protein [Fimbriimonadaceae bacterium]QYK55868.1 MAG: hypothetical protein KF733_12770 [Fimbriimonadaceae bacterium]